jgi:hypothetical protein
MNERFDLEISQDFKDALLGFYARPDPSPTFQAQLEGRLRLRYVSLREKKAAHLKVNGDGWASFKHYLYGRLWRLAVFALILALSAILLAIGPGRVLAQVQRMLGYLPGVGFVDLERARVLPAPVQVQQGKVTLQVDEVLATPDKTLVVFSTQGIGAGDLPWPNPAIGGDFAASLRLPDGSRLEARSWQLELAAGKVEFPPIPASVDRISLEIPRLPLVPEGAAPENWQVELTLVPAKGLPPKGLFPAPYSPTAAAVTAKGVSLEALQVAQGPEETGVLARLIWQDPAWQRVSWNQATLSDDLGHIYWNMPGASNAGVAVLSAPKGIPAPTRPAFSDEQTLHLAPLSLAARRATFSIPEVSYEVPVQGSFAFDPGPDPKPGQTWSLDERLEAVGASLHLVGARLTENPAPNHERGETRYSLEFVFQVSQPAGRQLNSMSWTASASGFTGQGGSSNGRDRFILSLNSDEIVHKPFRVNAESAFITLPGPWEVSWNLPGAPLGGSSVRRAQPSNPVTASHGVSLRLDDILQSDRITVIHLSVAQLPAGAQLLGFYPYNSSSANNRPFLQDQWGQALGNASSITWSPDGKPGSDPLQLIFAPAPALTQRLALTVPGVELLYPGQASFTFDVPPDLVFQPEQYAVTVIGGGGPERQETLTRMASRHWSVDIPIEIAGYSLHFSEAWVEVNEGSEAPYVLNLRGDPLDYRQGEQTLSTLRFSSVSRPDGTTDRVDYSTSLSGQLSLPSGGIGPESESSSRWIAGLALDVSAGNSFSLLPGRYTVELNGVTTWLAGPWRWSWSTVDGG